MNKISMRQLFVLIATIALGLTLTGCMSPQAESDIPWNTPQSWESQGVMGGLLNGGM
jgi:hypothetical protein